MAKRRLDWERLTKQLAEFALLRDDEERAQAADDLTRSRSDVRTHWIGIVVSAVAGGVLGGLFGPGLVRLGVPRWAAMIGISGSAVFVLGLLFARARRRREREFLRRRLIELGIPVCLDCGYDLRGQTEPRCPECGRPFDATLLGSTREKSAISHVE